MLQWVAILFEGLPYVVNDVEGFGVSIGKVVVLFSPQGVVVEFPAFFVAEAKVCRTPFVSLVGYSEEHVDEVG